MKRILLTESKEFMGFYDPELNPGFDISGVYSDDERKIRYRQEDGQIVEIIIRSLFKRKRLSEGYMHGELAKNVPGFLALFDEDLNPHIDPENLRTTDKVRMKYYDNSGRLREAYVYSVVVTLRNHKKGIYKPFKGAENKIGDDPKFWGYCTVSDLEEKERIRHLSRKSALQFPMICPKGHPFQMAPYQIFHHDIPCPYCRGRKIKAGISDAATADPEIADFWNEPDIDIHTISPIAQQSYRFKCPVCNYRFQRYMNQIIYRKPKCPACHGTGKQMDFPAELNLIDLPYDRRMYLNLNPDKSNATCKKAAENQREELSK